MNGYISLTNWDKFQHYKTRKPPWVKFYTDLARPDNKINQLPIPTRYLFDRLLLLAADYDNCIPNDPELLANTLRMPHEDFVNGCEQLRKGAWIKVTATRRRASRMLAPEKEKEKEKETPLPPLKETTETPNDGPAVVPPEVLDWMRRNTLKAIDGERKTA